MDLPSLEVARLEAIARIRAILDEEAAAGAINLDRRYDIVDEHGKIVLSVPFSAAID